MTHSRPLGLSLLPFLLFRSLRAPFSLLSFHLFSELSYHIVDSPLSALGVSLVIFQVLISQHPFLFSFEMELVLLFEYLKLFLFVGLFMLELLVVEHLFVDCHFVIHPLQLHKEV